MTANEEKVIKKNDDMVGKTFSFSGGLFSSKKALEPTEYEVLEWRWGSAKIMDMKTMKEIHPTVEFLLKNKDMKRSQWTRPFPVREIKLKDDD